MKFTLNIADKTAHNFGLNFEFTSNPECQRYLLCLWATQTSLHSFFLSMFSFFWFKWIRQFVFPRFHYPLILPHNFFCKNVLLNLFRRVHDGLVSHSFRHEKHVTINHDALDLTVQGLPSSPSPLQTSDLGSPIHPPAPAIPLLTPGGHHWRPVQTCPLEDPPISLGATSGRSHWSTYSLQREVCILLECFLLNNIFFISKHSSRMRTDRTVTSDRVANKDE